jgi:hypothetical protein
MATITSVFIPRIQSNVTADDVVQSFYNSSIAHVENVDFVLKQGRYGETYHNAYITIKKWYNTPVGHEVLNNVRRGLSSLMNPITGGYWTILPNTSMESGVPTDPPMLGDGIKRSTKRTVSKKRAGKRKQKIQLPEEPTQEEMDEAFDEYIAVIDEEIAFLLRERDEMKYWPDDDDDCYMYDEPNELVSSDYVSMLENELANIRYQQMMY